MADETLDSNPIIGALTLDDGETWTAPAVAVGVSAAAPSPGTLDVAASAAGAPTTLDVSGPISLGDDSTLDVRGGSRVSAAALQLQARSAVNLDAASAVVLGRGTAQGGAVVIGAGGTLTGISGTIAASIVLDGSLGVAPDLVGSDPGGPLFLDGVLGGTGSADVGLPGLPGADLEVASAVGFAGSIAIAGGATLALVLGDAPQATLAMNGGTVDLLGIAWDNGQSVAYDATSGRLTIGSSATLDVGAGAAAQDFTAGRDASGGTLLTEHRLPTWQATAAGAGGDWSDASHWGADGPPLASDTAEIGPGITAATPWTVGVTGQATVQDLTLAMGSTGTLAVADTGGLVVGTAGTAVAGAIAVGAGALLNVMGGALGGNLADQGGTVSLIGSTAEATGYPAVLVGSLSGTGTVTLDDAEVGAMAGFAGTLTVAGMVTVDAGAAATGPVQFDRPLGGAVGLDLRGVAWQPGTTLAYDPLSGVLTAGGATLGVGTAESVGAFAATADAAGGTLVTVACFAAGTAILTPRGPVPVERLAVGDRVVTRAHTERLAAPIRWIGRRRIDLAAHPHPDTLQPVRIRRDAVAPGVPARDLLLSPDHAVALGGVLIPVKYLVNGSTVAPDRGLVEIVYFHVELDGHDIVLAEALPVETYLDTGNRAAFANAAGPVALHHFAAKTWARDACAPLMGAGPMVDAVRARLVARGRLMA